MATRADIIKLLIMINVNFPNNKYDVDGPMPDTWYAMLGHFDLPTLQAALYKALETCKYPPTVADLRGALHDLVSQGLPSAGDAWSKAWDAVGWRRFDDYSRCEGHVDALTLKAVNLMGGFEALDNADNADVLRGQFTRTYNELKNRVIDEQLTSPMVLKVALALADGAECEVAMLTDGQEEMTSPEVKRLAGDWRVN